MSLDNLFCHQGTSHQQMVVAARTNEDKTLWLVKPSHESGDQSLANEPVNRGDTIRLEHIVTKRNLHSHPGIPAAIDRSQQEVTACGDNGRCDHYDNWIVEPEVGDAWLTDQPIRLIHKDTKAALHSHVNSHQIYTAGYQEVTGFSTRDENDLWICRSTEQPTSDLQIRVPLHQRTWFQTAMAGAVLVGVIFQITGPLPASFLLSLPTWISALFQPVSNLLSTYGSFIAAGLVLLLVYWKRTTLRQLCLQIAQSIGVAYVTGLAFVLRPVIHHIDATQLRIIRARYGAHGKFTNVAKILRQRIIQNKLEVAVTNQNFGPDPIPSVAKQIVVEYVYFGKKSSVTVDEKQNLKLP